MRPLIPNSDYHQWKALLREAGVRDARLHDTRHTAATVLLVLGVPERTVMSVMGWSSTSMAARYQHVTDPIRRDVARRVGPCSGPMKAAPAMPIETKTETLPKPRAITPPLIRSLRADPQHGRRCHRSLWECRCNRTEFDHPPRASDGRRNVLYVEPLWLSEASGIPRVSAARPSIRRSGRHERELQSAHLHRSRRVAPGRPPERWRYSVITPRARIGRRR